MGGGSVMEASHLTYLLPFILLAATAVSVMLAIAARRSHIVAVGLSVAGLAGCVISLPFVLPSPARAVTPLLMVDGYAFFFVGLLCAASAAVVIFGYEYQKLHGGHREEFYLLVVLATLGASVLAASIHFASFFLGLELLSVSLYGLIAYLPQRRRGIEASVKYLILAGASSAFLLFGMALIYAEVGALDFEGVAAALRGNDLRPTLVLPGIGLMLAGVGFKLAVVPFHMWTPDVYEGAPAPVSALIATVSKASVVAVLLRFFIQADLYDQQDLVWVFGTIAVASMFVGNLLALLEDNVKRIVAYSSIAHLGYALVALVAGGEWGPEAVIFYMVAYVITTLGAFGSVSVLSRDGGDEADLIDEYYGLFWRRPVVSAVLTASLLSLAGIPLTAGFFGKWYVLAAGGAESLWTLVLLVVLNSAIGLFYYLRVVVMLYRDPAEETSTAGLAPNAPASPLGTMTLAALLGVLVAVGVYPQPVLDLIEVVVSGLG